MAKRHAHTVIEAGRRAPVGWARWLLVSSMGAGILIAATAVPASAQSPPDAAAIPQTSIISATQVGRQIQIVGSAACAHPAYVDVAILGGTERGIVWDRQPVSDSGARPIGFQAEARVPAVDGREVTVLARVVDISGAVDPSPAVFGIVADGVPPIVVGLTVDRGAPATNRRAVTLTSVVRGAQEMRYTMSERDLDFAAWVPYRRNVRVPINGVDGAKTLFVQFADAMGNETDPRDGALTFLVDRTPPQLVDVAPVSGGLDLVFDEPVLARSPVSLSLNNRPISAALVPTQRHEVLHLRAPALGSGARYDLSIPANCGVTDIAGNQADRGRIEFVALDGSPPTPPPSVVATSDQSLVRLDWGQARDDDTIAAYRVYRSSSPLPPRPDPRFLLGQVSGRGYVDDSGISNAKYDYAVSAVDAAGNESTISKQTTVRVGVVGLYHGEQTSNTNLCKDCHGAADRPGLTQAQSERQRCYSCHDGTGSRFNTQADFGEGGATTSTSSHPVTNGRLRCGDCHTPHRSPLEVPRLLTVKLPDGTRIESGPRYCLVCHDELPAGGRGSSLRIAGSAYAASAHGSLPVADGTGVSCSACHRGHSSAQPALLAAPQTALCLGCHDKTVARGPQGWNVRAQFGGASHHAVDGTTTDGLSGAVLSCSSCHDAHAARRGALGVSDPAARLIDPAARGASPTPWSSSDGDITQFCLRCHRGVGAKDGTVTVGVAFPVVDAARYPLFGGWDETRFIGSAHATGSALAPGERQCTMCHQPHGSDNPRTLLLPEDTTTTAGMCFECHAGTRPGVADVRGAFLKPSHHPTLDKQGLHSDVEGPQELGYNGGVVNTRHAECQDCHDPHGAKPGLHTPGAALAAPALNGAMGVTVDRWPSTAFTGPSSADFKTARMAAGVAEEWQLCLKCHSNYTTLPPGDSTATPPRDMAAEFNPANPSYHAVIGASKAGSRISFVVGSPWASSSRMTCTDCHGNDETSTAVAAGPHGSKNAGLLVRPFSGETGMPGTDGDLCFGCHDRAVYGGGDDPTLDQSGTAFSDGARNLHDVGTPGSGHRVACVACHSAVVHGGRQKALLVSGEDVAPYRAAGAPGVTLTAGMPQPGLYRVDSCVHEGACHLP